MVLTPAGLNSFTSPSGGPPSVAGVAVTELLPRAVPVFAAQPSKDPLPSVGPQVVEGRAGTAVSEVGGPAPQKPVEPDQQDVERLVRVLPADRSIGPRPLPRAGPRRAPWCPTRRAPSRRRTGPAGSSPDRVDDAIGD